MTARPLLLTGAAGVLGRWLRPRLVEIYGALRSSDIHDPGRALPMRRSWWPISRMRMPSTAWSKVSGGSSISAVSPKKTTFDRILAANIVGTYNVFEAARRQGAGPIVYASSNHAIGFYTRDDRLDANVRHGPTRSTG